MGKNGVKIGWPIVILFISAFCHVLGAVNPLNAKQLKTKQAINGLPDNVSVDLFIERMNEYGDFLALKIENKRTDHIEYLIDTEDEGCPRENKFLPASVFRGRALFLNASLLRPDSFVARYFPLFMNLTEDCRINVTVYFRAGDKLWKFHTRLATRTRFQHPNPKTLPVNVKKDIHFRAQVFPDSGQRTTLVVLAENKDKQPHFVRLARANFTCSEGEAFISQIDNYRKILRAGEFGVAPGSWHAYSIVVRIPRGLFDGSDQCWGTVTYAIDGEDVRVFRFEVPRLTSKEIEFFNEKHKYTLGSCLVVNDEDNASHAQ
ncbi:MAG: hypothetical protein D6732_23530 [Methanobacteriota archaeon]|nr:MAG: hypothetical protein D6732_23530 [Euryarchaeota archaeon]